MKSRQLKQAARRSPGEVRAVRKLLQAAIVVRCPGCHLTRTIVAREISAGEFPMCTTCSLPLIPVGRSLVQR